MPTYSLDEFFKRGATGTPRNVMRMPDGTVQVPMEQIFGAKTPAQEIEPAAFKRGYLSTKSDFTAAGGLVADLFGYDEAAQGMYQRAKELSEERDAIPRRVGRVEDIHNPIDLGVFAFETLAENAPMLASIAIPGMSVAKIAGLGGKVALTKAVEKGASAFAAKAAQLAARKRIAGTAAAFLSDVGLQTGESAQIVRDAGGDPEDWRVVGSGLGKGALDFVPITVLARRLGLLKGLPLGEAVERNISGELVQKGFIRRAAGHAGTLIAYEVPTEVAQEVINIALDRSISQFEGQLTPEEKSQLLNAAGGAAAFGLLGIPAAVRRPTGNFRPATDEELSAADDAADSAPRIAGYLPAPQTAPQIAGLLPAPVDTAPYDPAFDSVKTGTEVSNAVARSLGRELRQDRPDTYLVTEEGVILPNVPDSHSQIANVVRDIPEFQRTPIETAIVKVDDAKQEAILQDSHELKYDRSLDPHYPPTITTLLMARDDTYLNEGFRRSKDGQINAQGRKRIQMIDNQIGAITKRLGLPNPLEETRTYTLENAETQLQQVNKQEENKPRPDIKLTETESALLERLEAKDYEDGLTPREEDIRERLLAKREGERPAEREALTAEEVKNLRKLGAELGDEESTQVLLRTDKQSYDDIHAEIKQLTDDIDRMQKDGHEPTHTGLASEVEMDGEMTLAEAVESAKQRIQNLRKELAAFGAPTTSLTDRLLFENSQKLARMKGEINDLNRHLTEMKSRPHSMEQAKRIEGKLAALKEKEKSLSAQQERLFKSLLMRKQKGEVPGIPIKDAARVVEQMTAKMVNGPEFIVANSNDERAFVDQPAKRAKISGGAKGAFFLDEPNKVYIFADKHESLDDVAKTVFHETLAHYGLRAYFPEEELNALIVKLYQDRGAEIQERFGVPESAEQARVHAEEYIAEIAENGLDMSILQRIIAAIKRVWRKINPKLKFTDNDIRFMLRDVSKFLTGRVPGRNPAGLTTYMSQDAFLRAAGRKNVEDVLPQIDTFKSIWGGKFAGWVLTPLQMAAKFNIPGAQKYLELVQQWSARRGELTKNPADIADTWMKLPKREGQRLAKMILEIQERSDELARRLTQEEVAQIFKRNDGSKVSFDLYTRIDESFRTTLNQLQVGLEKSAIRNAVREHPNPTAEAKRLHDLWTKDQSKEGRSAFFEEVAKSPSLQNFHLGDRLIRIENEVNTLRQRNYFPRMRFGKYAIVVRAGLDTTFEGKKFKGARDGGLGEVLTYETYETIPARDARWDELQRTTFKDKAKYHMQKGLVTDAEFSFLGMPPSLFEALDAKLGLSDKQRETLKELYYQYSPGRAFLRHLTRRKGIAGYSEDAMRVYSSYMMNAANHIARVEYHEAMSEQLNVMREAARTATYGTRYGQVSEYFSKHYNYLMNPEEDLAKYRAMGFLWYLGFNVKSAFVNLTQVPMVAYPFLAHHYGDAAATAAIARAYKMVSQRLLGRSIYDNATDEDIARGVRERFLDESFATELAGLGESSVLQRLMPEQGWVRQVNKVGYYGSLLFKHAEKFNREVVFVAARELALKNRPGDREGAYLDARKAVQATMFEYSKWNRPAFMRGKKSVFFLFWQYMQHLSYMAYGGEGKGAAMRVWAMLLLAAGLQGLPFAENFFDLVDFGGTKMKELLGMKNPRVDLRDDLRALASEITDQPDLIMHGLSRYYGLGPLHLMAAMGAPIPHTDISGSLSAGKVIPGTDQAFGEERDPNAKFGRTMAEVLGPVVGVGYTLWKAMESDDPDTWKVWERAMPTALASASKAARRGIRGEESFRGGGAVAEFDPHAAEQRAENIAQAFGFSTTRVNQRFELRASQEGLKQYWVVRRSMVLENYAYALLSHDQEAVADARKALKKFNQDAPAPGLKISSDTLEKSIRERFRRGQIREHGLPDEKAFLPLYKKLEQANPEGAPS